MADPISFIFMQFSAKMLPKTGCRTCLWDILDQYSSGSSGRVRGGGPSKHEIYAAAFGGHLFYDLFSQGQGGHGPLGPPGSATAVTVNLFMYCQNFHCICSSEDQLCLWDLTQFYHYSVTYAQIIIPSQVKI